MDADVALSASGVENPENQSGIAFDPSDKQA